MLPQAPIAASEFKLSDAIAHLNSQTAGTYQLWAFYTATVLGSLALALSHQMTEISAPIFLAGFWAFALGELALLRRSMSLINEMRVAVAHRLDSVEDNNIAPYRSALASATRNWNPIWVTVLVQIIGDLCVTALMAGNALHWFVVQ
ncbi:MAG: hypothetical protein E5V92_15740 [Mesorhizobium sp.]|uniref:hypothetical protein n=1 Tax=unclassified Mesorhizobium TaxID=325217 RepID=UPI000F75A576|nr:MULTISPECIES: hypothetical protein [unclassified Mesorhizobium]AZO72601.1 hypothetical protein EJ067_16590 [Mesorhizobium sp. M1D.F.Ca.ET.043.01.1.1]RWA81956.1 MAG: hypothetical protein EOQ32_29520 [Mesorhizobium sp.]RWE05132.1 MAG: hypothetical protein EOS61_23730 [Mesorhizobium sp.]TJW85164.1 MAG: hypothetical protein E5V92_15740 [Mesorhizobium sp.]